MGILVKVNGRNEYVNGPADLLISEKKSKLGSGKRFAQLENKLANQGAKDPAALAAVIGRRKYGDKKFNKLAAERK